MNCSWFVVFLNGYFNYIARIFANSLPDFFGDADDMAMMPHFNKCTPVWMSVKSSIYLYLTFGAEFLLHIIREFNKTMIYFIIQPDDNGLKAVYSGIFQENLPTLYPDDKTICR